MISAFGVDHGEVSKAFSLPGMKAGVNAMNSLRQGFKGTVGPSTKLNMPTKVGMAAKTGATSIKSNLKPLGAGLATGGAGGLAMGNRNKRP